MGGIISRHGISIAEVSGRTGRIDRMSSGRPVKRSKWGGRASGEELKKPGINRRK